MVHAKKRHELLLSMRDGKQRLKRESSRDLVGGKETCTQEQEQQAAAAAAAPDEVPLSLFDWPPSSFSNSLGIDRL